MSFFTSLIIPDFFYGSPDDKPNEKGQKVLSSAELLAQAVGANQISIASNVLEGFANDTERAKALQFRNCYHGTPLGTAIEKGIPDMVSLVLSYIPDKEAASGEQCSTIEGCYGKDDHGRSSHKDVNAATIALKRCSEDSSYPCEKILDILRKRDVFEILRETPDSSDKEND